MTESRYLLIRPDFKDQYCLILRDISTKMEHIILKTGHVSSELKTEILESYRESGAACVHSAGEDVSFVLTDLRNKVFIAKRGIFSSVPVYYYYLEGGHVVCNFLLKELLPFVKFPLRPCEKKIEEYFSILPERQATDHLTFYQDIFRLLPGEYLVKEEKKDCTSGFAGSADFPETRAGEENREKAGTPEGPVKECIYNESGMADPMEDIRHKIRMTIQPDAYDGINNLPDQLCYQNFIILFERFKDSCGSNYLRHPVWGYCNRAIFEEAVQVINASGQEPRCEVSALYRVICLALWLEYVDDLNRRAGRLRVVS